MKILFRENNALPDKSKSFKRSLTQFVRTLVHMDSGFNGIQIKDDPELLQEIEISVQFPYLKLETVK